MTDHVELWLQAVYVSASLHRKAQVTANFTAQPATRSARNAYSRLGSTRYTLRDIKLHV